MTWAEAKSTGIGGVRYALEVEGWPELFVTDPGMTLASSLNGRTVIAGLLYEGLGFSERLIPQEAIVQASGMSFAIRSTSRADAAMASFTDFGERVAFLGADVTVGATSLTLTGGTLQTSTVYHIGTEAVLTTATSSTTISSRAYWGTATQAHSVNYFDLSQPIHVFDRPPTMDGRRVRLYAFGRNDDATSLGNGSVIWRGVVTKPPMLDADGVTWRIQADSIVSLLAQTLVGHQYEANLVGIYHHELAPVVIEITYEGASSTTRFVEGLYLSPEDLADAITTQLSAAVGELSASKIDSLVCVYDTTANQYRIELITGSIAISALQVIVGSPLIGWANGTFWRDENGNDVLFSALSLATSYTNAFEIREELSPSHGWQVTTAAEPAFPSTWLWGPDLWSQLLHLNIAWPPYLTAGLVAPAGRIHVDADLSLSDGEFITIGDIAFLVTSTGTTNGVNWIEVSPNTNDPNQPGRLVTPGADYNGFLGPDTKVRPLINLGDSDSLNSFIDNVVSKGKTNGNDGVTPYLQLGDFASAGVDVNWDFTATLVDEIALRRRYSFSASVPLRDVIKGELQLIGHILYLDSDGKMDIRPLPFFTETTTTTKTLSESEIVTPAGSYGSWPGYEIQAEGLVNTITFYDGYKAGDDAWASQITVRDSNSIATHKNRGRGDMEIRLYSRNLLGEMSAEEAAEVAGFYFTFLARPYALIRVQVPLNRFDYLVGDVLKLTHPTIPNGEGARGVTNRRAVVMARRWNLDPASGDAPGEFDLLVFAEAFAGYAPSAVITSQSGSGVNWTVTCDTADAENIRLSTSNNGQCLEHFAVGDYVEVRQRNTAGTTNVDGRITAVNAGAGTADVSFASTWTPGANSWVLEYRGDGGSESQTSQQSFVYVADGNLDLPNGNYARRFV